MVYRNNRPVPPLEEQREEAGRLLIEAFVLRRLIPLGCVRAAIDDDGRKLCIAREPRLDAYFGREVDRADLAPTAKRRSEGGGAAGFQRDRDRPEPGRRRRAGAVLRADDAGRWPGALVLKITRDSVVKAVSHGLKPAEIADRLRRHASNEVPANVLREVQDWSSWVRQVTASTLTVLRCPDRDTADRVVSALKRQAERVNDTLVAIDQKKLTSTERNKLRDHGIIVEGESEAAEGKAKCAEEEKESVVVIRSEAGIDDVGATATTRDGPVRRWNSGHRSVRAVDGRRGARQRARYRRPAVP